MREAQQLNGKDKSEEQASEADTMNPMQTILFSQMIIKAWNSYAMIKEGKVAKSSDQQKNRLSILNKKDKKRDEEEDEDSYLNSCRSIGEEAKLEVLDTFKKRRQGMIVMDRSSKPFIPDTDGYYE